MLYFPIVNWHIVRSRQGHDDKSLRSIAHISDYAPIVIPQTPTMPIPNRMVWPGFFHVQELAVSGTSPMADVREPGVRNSAPSCVRLAEPALLFQPYRVVAGLT